MHRILWAVALASSFTAVAADVAPFLHDEAYDRGEYGPYPNATFHSSALRPPRLNFLQAPSRCSDGLYLMFDPRGDVVDQPGPVILDEQGSLVWASTEYNSTYGLMVQQYAGHDYLTFWAGDDLIRGHGAGYYYMLDSTYSQVRRIGAANGLMGDLHDFRITQQGTALMTIYQTTRADLSYYEDKPTDGWLWDCLFQEVDIESGEMLFQWRASDHMNLQDSHRVMGFDGAEEDTPYDFFHINSVDKDPHGNYLVSSRYMHSLTYISGVDGHTIWTLGGSHNSFTDLSDGQATNFEWQHDARWENNYTTITLFDNGAQTDYYSANYTRGLHIELDTVAMTAKLLQAYIRPDQLVSSSQGSMQILPNGNVFMGYGFSGALTEFAANGTLLCDMHFGAASDFETGSVQSYRGYKFNWKGYPTDSPALSIFARMAYVSWNGATEVAHWLVQGADQAEASESEFRHLIKVDRHGFETEIALPNHTPDFVRIVALDSTGKMLGHTLPIYSGNEDDPNLWPYIDEEHVFLLWVAMGLIGGASIVIGSWEVLSCWRRYKGHRYRKCPDDHDIDLDLDHGLDLLHKPRRSKHLPRL